MAESSYDSGQEGRGRGQSHGSFNEKLGEFRKFASTSFTRAKQVNQQSKDHTILNWLLSHSLPHAVHYREDRKSGERDHL